jgi:DNA replication and repair protein RecF
VGYAATTRSFRGAAPEALIRDGASAAIVRVAGTRAERDFLVEAELPITGRTRVQLNHQRVSRARDLVDALLVSVFTPDDLGLVKGGPIERRRYLDEVMVALHPRHDAVRADVERILRQKSALLKQARGARTADVQTTLDVWNTKLAEAGEELATAREEVLGLLGPVVTTAYHQIAGVSPTTEVVLTYDSAWRGEGLAAALARVQVDELRRGVCLVGPQRDDVGIALGGASARTHASQGEQRSLALALRLGAHRLITEVVGVAPVLLLDDIFSELDPERSAALLAHLPSGQAMLTTAGPLPAGAHPARTLRVEAGAVRIV